MSQVLVQRRRQRADSVGVILGELEANERNESVEGYAQGVADDDGETVAAEPADPPGAVAAVAPRPVVEEPAAAAAAAAAAEEEEAPRVEPDDNNSYNNENDRLCPRDPSRMELTDQERQWALAIKTAIEQSPEIDNLSDFEYAQYALVDQDNVAESVQRAEHFQIFHKEYDLTNTCEQAKRIVRAAVELQPTVPLCLSYNEEQGNYVIVYDMARVRESNLKTDNDYRTLLAYAYFSGHFLSPDFAAIRLGASFVMECEDYDWKNFSMKTRRRIWSEIVAKYPLKMQRLKYFHTGLYANLAVSLMKKVLPHEMYSKIEVGCQFPGRLDTYYAVPTVELANQRLIRTMEACLERRFENMRKFKLER